MIWSISMRYLLTHQRQTIVCIAGVSISVMIFLGMSAMMKGFRDKFIIETVESSGHVTVNDEPRESTTPILQRTVPDRNALLVLERTKPRDQVKQIKNPTGVIAKLRRLPGVVAAAPEVTGDAIASYGTRTMSLAIVGVEPEEQQRVTTIGQKLTAGSFERLRTTADGIVVGVGVALSLGAQLGDSIVVTSPTGGRINARVVGVFSTGVTPVDYSRAYLLLNNAQTLLDKKNVINRVNVRTEDYTQARAMAAQIESIVGYKTESWQESNANFLKIFAIQDVITYVIIAALLVVAAFGVLNILVMSVLDRVNDIAILKSLGLSRRDISLLFFNQGLVIGFVGALLGLLAGKLLIEGLRRLPVTMEGLVKAEGLLMSERTYNYVLSFVAAMIVVMIASVYPARRAALYDPVEVIRGAH